MKVRCLHLIELKVEHLNKLQELLGNTPKQIPIVTARAINRAALAGRTQAARSTREAYYIKHGDVISTIKVKKANSNDLMAEFRSRDTNLELTKFKVTPSTPHPGRKRQLTVSVKKGSKKTIKNAFVARLLNPRYEGSQLRVLTRVTSKRYPVRGHYGPSIPQMIGSEDVMKRIEERTREVLDTRLNHEISRMLGGSS